MWYLAQFDCSLFSCPPHAIMSSASPRFAEWLLRWRWILLGCGVVSGLLAYGPAQEVEFDRSIENVFAPDDTLVVTYRKLARIFGGN